MHKYCCLLAPPTIACIVGVTSISTPKAHFKQCDTLPAQPAGSLFKGYYKLLVVGTTCRRHNIGMKDKNRSGADPFRPDTEQPAIRFVKLHILLYV